MWGFQKGFRGVLVLETDCSLKMSLLNNMELYEQTSDTALTLFSDKIKKKNQAFNKRKIVI